MVLLHNMHVHRYKTNWLNRFFGAQIVYKIVLAFAKASICHTYYRIFHVSSSKFRIACHATQFVIVTSAIAFIVGTIFQCRPVRAFWDQSIADASCIDQTPWWMSFAIVQITTDVVILILPAKQVFKLQISRTKRLGILLAFCTGLFVTFTSIFRATTLASSATNSDPTCKYPASLERRTRDTTNIAQGVPYQQRHGQSSRPTARSSQLASRCYVAHSFRSSTASETRSQRLKVELQVLVPQGLRWGSKWVHIEVCNQITTLLRSQTTGVKAKNAWSVQGTSM